MLAVKFSTPGALKAKTPRMNNMIVVSLGIMNTALFLGLATLHIYWALVPSADDHERDVAGRVEIAQGERAVQEHAHELFAQGRAHACQQGVE